MKNLWTRCNHCQRILYKQDILDNSFICPECLFHFRISAEDRLKMLFDDGKYELFDQNLYPMDPLEFVDSKRYADRITENQKKTNQPDAVLNAVGVIGGIRTIVCSMNFAFMGGSMGSVVGEKITRALEKAFRKKIRLLLCPVPEELGCRREPSPLCS